MDRDKLISVGALVLIVAAGIGYGVFGIGKSQKPATTTPEIVATVDGVDILKSAYDTQLATAVATLKAQGVNTDDAAKMTEIKTQVLNDLINNQLVAQAVVKAGITVPVADIEKQYQALVTSAGGAEGFKAELVKANLTDAQLRENISKQLAIQAYLLQNIDINSITVSEAEITQFYKDYSKANGTTTPALKTLHDQIKQQIVTNKQQLLVSTFLASLRGKATIETKI